jgi:hypothetical protein
MSVRTRLLVICFATVTSAVAALGLAAAVISATLASIVNSTIVHEHGA